MGTLSHGRQVEPLEFVNLCTQGQDTRRKRGRVGGEFSCKEREKDPSLKQTLKHDIETHCLVGFLMTLHWMATFRLTRSMIITAPA